MSAIAGIVNTNRTLHSEKYFVEKMSSKMSKREKNGIINCICYDNAHFSCVSTENLPQTFEFFEKKYTIMYDGEIYNFDEIIEYLTNKYPLRGNENQAEMLAILYHISGNSFLKKLNGIFSIAIWNEYNKELFLARDRFGVKPLFYTIKNNTLYFASEIKGIFANVNIKAILDKQGLNHIFAIGPNIMQGSGIFKDIHELSPATMATYNKYGLKAYKYWDLESKNHYDSKEETIERVYKLATESIKNQIKDDNICCFLSGGLDSSIITSITAKNTKHQLNTFSVEYAGNEEYFTPNEYQPNSDIEYINLMSKTFGTHHEVIKLCTDDLIDNLEEAVIAREHPGLADIDSSLLCFCKKIGKNFDYSMSGECADEVFGGYPWFHRKEDFEAKTFPWSRNIELRQNIVNPNLFNINDIPDYIDKCYEKSLSETPYLYSENDEEKRRREIAHLNIRWFMYSLGERSERIGTNNDLKIRMPFCDYKLVEYVWNIPWNIKALDGREKGLLRKCFSLDLPEEIVFRKKSPYPKTHNPEFEHKIKEKLTNTLNNSDSKIKDLINTKYLKQLMDNESDYGKPWFGQLMATPQLYAYLLQIDFWLKYYKVNIEI